MKELLIPKPLFLSRLRGGLHGEFSCDSWDFFLSRLRGGLHGADWILMYGIFLSRLRGGLLLILVRRLQI